MSKEAGLYLDFVGENGVHYEGHIIVWEERKGKFWGKEVPELHFEYIEKPDGKLQHWPDLPPDVQNHVDDLLDERDSGKRYAQRH